jgi:hypothetical protein
MNRREIITTGAVGAATFEGVLTMETRISA